MDQTRPESLSGPWCNANAVTSSIMEAISFITPALENFFIRTVADGMPDKHDSALHQRCVAFIHEEASHTRAHGVLNRSLLDYLKHAPPGLRSMQMLLGSLRKYARQPTLLFLVVALEHFSTVLSKRYLMLHQDWQIGCPYAKTLFEQHALEELGHRSVVFDLWTGYSSRSRPARATAIWAILFLGMLYISIASPWILYQKMQRKLLPTLSVLMGYIITRRPNVGIARLIGELFSFVRLDYHPDNLIAADFAYGGD
jgi:predicted metal-dependent hydrolase